MQNVGVIDIGKTNLKVALVSLTDATETAVRTAPNSVRLGPPWPHFDVDAQWAFIQTALAGLSQTARIDGLVVTTHGACAALLARDGALAAPVMDYEFEGLQDSRPAYDALRPAFSQTGSPALPMGLNLGAQLHHMLKADPDLPGRVAQVVTWPQYWGFRLTGQVATDVCSLGCHTDLWDPLRKTWSDLPARLGLAGKMAPARLPAEILGTLLPARQAETGLGAVPVLVGIHDSNASLVPYLVGQAAPFAVVSTGTWVIAMAIGGAPKKLDPARDALLNVNALGQAVPSARFMGGREYEILHGSHSLQGTQADAQVVLRRNILCLPAVVPGCGPFPRHLHVWKGPAPTEAERAVAADFYLALMTAECLTQVGARGPVLLEGPFARNIWFLKMLAAATGEPVLPAAGATGTSIGAASLFRSAGFEIARPDAVLPLPNATAYIGAWRQHVGAVH